ncbi:MAG: hypothetical protein ACTSWP_06070 [Candidatus Freyarchaeota archaeon]
MQLLSSKQSGVVKVAFLAECPICKRTLKHEVELEGERLEAFEEAVSRVGVAPLSFNHGDHILIVYVDRYMAARASYAHPIQEAHAAALAEEWTRVSVAPVEEAKNNVIFLNYDKKRYCDSYWRMDIPAANVISNVERGGAIFRFDDVEVWALSFRGNRLVVAREANWQGEYLEYISKFLNGFEGVDAAEDRLFHHLTLAVLSDVKVLAAAMDASRIVSDRWRRMRVLMAPLEAFPEDVKERLKPILVELSRGATVEEALLKASLEQKASFVANYRMLRNLRILIPEQP